MRRGESSATWRKVRTDSMPDIQDSMPDIQRDFLLLRDCLGVIVGPVVLDISTVTSEEEWKWGQLYDCRDDIGKALQTVQHLEIELDECDEVLLSEELHILRLKRQEMEEDMSELRLKLSDCSSELETKTKESTSLRNQIDGIEKDNRSIEQQIVEREIGRAHV